MQLQLEGSITVTRLTLNRPKTFTSKIDKAVRTFEKRFSLNEQELSCLLNYNDDVANARTTGSMAVAIECILAVTDRFDPS